MPVELIRAVEVAGSLEDAVQAERVVEELVCEVESQEMQEFVGKMEIPVDEPVKDISDLNAKISEMATPDGISEISYRYPEIQDKIEDLRSKLENAEGPKDAQQVDVEAMQYRGTVTERIVETSLSSNFDNVVEGQFTVLTDLGATRPDVVLEDAKIDFSLGDLEVANGDDLFIEVKTGSSDYLRNEMSHILKQVGGHQGSSAVFVTRDYLRIPSDVRRAFEEELSSKDSTVVVMDVTSSQIDAALAALLESA